jgi:PAS domain S-box-containing protein
MTILCLGALGWVALLRRRVREQTGIILERLQREVALEERYRDLFENASDMVYTHDLAGNLTSLNRAGERITGYSREEALKLNLVQLVSPECLELARQILRHDQPDCGAAYEIEIVTRDGRCIPIEVGARIIHRDGQPEGVQCNARDITDRRRAEADMKRAKEAAEAASRAKSEFLANISHEIRTPMNGIVGMVQLLLETPVNPEQREYVSIIKTSANSLMTVINDLLDFSKIEAGKLALESVDFNLRDRVNETVKALGLQAKQKGLELSLFFDPNVPDSLVGDPIRLKQILLNLIGNAVKFTHKGQVAVRVDVDGETAEEALLRFSVRDTGIGILIDKQALIFEPFRQADGSTTELSAVRGLV